MYFAVTNSMITGTEQVKETIESSVVTFLEEDSHGHPIVKDTSTGLVTSSRTVGDSFRTLLRYDPVSGLQVPCIDMGSVGAMFNDATSSTPSSVTFVDEQGEERSVQQLDGNFADHGDYLHFGGAEGGLTIMMNSDICNTAVDTKPQDDESGMAGNDAQAAEKDAASLENASVEYELDIKPALDKALGETMDSSSSEEKDGLFTRRDLIHDDSASSSLRVRYSSGPQGIARVPSLNAGIADKDVKVRLREVFAKAKSVGPDRKLSSGTYVQACTGASCQVSTYSLLVYCLLLHCILGIAHRTPS